jgi:hypothetical protein
VFRGGRGAAAQVPSKTQKLFAPQVHSSTSPVQPGGSGKGKMPEKSTESSKKVVPIDPLSPKGPRHGQLDRLDKADMAAAAPRDMADMPRRPSLPEADRRNSVADQVEQMMTQVSEFNRVRYPHSQFNRYFDNVLAGLLLFTTLISPFEIAYLDSNGLALFLLNRVVDLGFMIDIWVSFTTAYLNESGAWIKHPKKIAIHYLQGSFCLDFVSTVPWDLFGELVSLGSDGGNASGGNAKLLRLLKLMKLTKMIRLVKSSKAVTKLKQKVTLKSSEWNLLKYLAIMVVVMHWTACGWGMFPLFNEENPAAVDIVASPNNATSANNATRLLREGLRRLKGASGGSNSMLDDIPGAVGASRLNWIERMELQLGHSLSISDKYGLSLDDSLSVMCMGYGTIAPTTLNEIWFSITCMLFAGGTYAYVIGKQL